MGKIKQKRHTLHLFDPAPKPANLEDKGQLVAENEDFETTVNKGPIISSSLFQNVSIPSNLFKDVSIPPQALKQKLPAYSAKDRSNLKVKKVLTSAQREEWEQHLRKTCARKKVSFSEVVSSVLDFLKQKEQDEKEKATAILGNYKSLKDALTDLDQLMEEHKVKPKEQIPRGSKSFSKQEAEMMQDIQTYKEVLSDSQYASDPFGAITAHLKQKLQSGLL